MRDTIRLLALAIVASVALVSGAAAQISSAPNTIPGAEANPFPVIQLHSDYDRQQSGQFRHLPYRDLATAISIALPTNALYDFNVMAVRAGAEDYMQQTANLWKLSATSCLARLQAPDLTLQPFWCTSTLGKPSWAFAVDVYTQCPA